MKRLIAALLLMAILPMAAHGGGILGAGSSSVERNDGGGHRQIDLDTVLTALQEGKLMKPQKFKELKELLYIDPLVPQLYNKNILLGLSISCNKTLSRNDEFVISATVDNPNPMKIRRPLYLDLMAMEPGERSFKKVNQATQIIQLNEYQEYKDGRNISVRTFPDLTSFSNLKTAGPVVLRLLVSDGQYSWNSQNLTLNVTNTPPRLECLSIISQLNPRYNDAIIFAVNATDRDDDPVNITLHLLDEHGVERGNTTQIIAGKGTASFLGNDFFSKSDAGRNFTYYYSFGDGIAANKTAMQDGPSIRKSISIYVEKPWVTPEDQNQYWWQSYNFTVNMKNQDPIEAKIRVTLFTNTRFHPWRQAISKEVTLTQEPSLVSFDLHPFDVLDANRTFDFKFAYSEYDQYGKDFTQVDWEKPLNGKLIKYEAVSPQGIGNVMGILLIALGFSILFERRFFR